MLGTQLSDKETGGKEVASGCRENSCMLGIQLSDKGAVGMEIADGCRENI